MEHGSCFYNEAVKGVVRTHPWVILSDPSQNENDVLIVNFTDADNHYDHSCVVLQEEYPEALTKRSCIAYMYANVTSLKFLELADQKGYLRHKQPVPEEVMQKILEGAVQTDELDNGKKMLLRNQGLI